ncbi:WD repeat-containing protein 55 homolog [Chelonus insularis]|uniref:WD repeat-containing protein 55 homolog n=1 Tax=Chelonus insularis TaxID=460826 RepID=UPI00158EEFB9|nr:WD repeat-containing protein 55 homolog [Chelonus insularis]
MIKKVPKMESDDNMSDVSMTSADSSSEEEDENMIDTDENTDSSEDDKNNEEEEEDDTLVNAINASSKSQRNHPPEIKVEDYVVNICFNPSSDTIALANVEGDILIYNYSVENTNLLSTIEVHEKACRDLKFNDSGVSLWSVSKDKSIAITDVNTEKLTGIYEKAHDDPIYVINLLTEHTFATGDDSGTVKLWDLRQNNNKPTFSIKEVNDYISSMITNEEKKYLICASGDGSLLTLDIRSKKIFCQSVEYDEEFTCLGLFKNNTKVLVGCSTGKLYIFNWGEFGYHSDEFINLNKKSINCMVPITDNIVITGNEDGTLRALGLFPNSKLGIAGQHEFSIEAIDISNDGKLIASTSHDNIVKFWNVEYFENFNLDEKEVKNVKHTAKKHNLPSSKVENPSTFFADMDM